VSLPKGSSAGDSLVQTTTTTATLQSKHSPSPSNFNVTTKTTTVDNNTISVGGDWPISGSLTDQHARIGAAKITPARGVSSRRGVSKQANPYLFAIVQRAVASQATIWSGRMSVRSAS